MQLVNTKHLPQEMKESAQLCLVHVQTDSHDDKQGYIPRVTTKEESILPEDAAKLLRQYQHLFEEPTSLPPRRGTFDHRIPLQAGRQPVNIRPYRYPETKGYH